MKQKFISYYSDVAKRTAELSHARRLKVGAVIVKNDSILSYGYNGMPSAFDNNCEDYEFRQEKDINGNLVTVNTNNLITKPEVIHAEVNAIAKVAKRGDGCDSAVMFITHSPCVECAKIICQTGIKTVYYCESYRSDAGLNLLHKARIDIFKV